jgi:hypothetical protein
MEILMTTYTYAPGDSTAADSHDRVKLVCAAVWTETVIADYSAAHPVVEAVS